MIAVKFGVATAGAAHVVVAVYVGPDKDHLAFCGDFKLRNEEWSPFRAQSLYGDAQNEARLSIQYSDEAHRQLINAESGGSLDTPGDADG